MKTGNLIEETKEFFGILYPFVCDDDMTDIDYNGKELWITYSNNYRECITDIVNDDFCEQFCARVSNAVSKPFNKQYPVLEAETEFLRITIIHESVAVSGRCFCIRKSLPSVRLTEETMLSTGFCSREELDFLKKCIADKKNIVFCGEPGAGKTECAKFFSKYIEKDEKVITIEDNAEWHYSLINEGKDCIELKVNDIVDYSLAIKTCLRLNPKWIMLSEVRSSEVVYLLECFSTGVKGITTIHTDDVRKIPDRMLNMAGKLSGKNMENDIYSFIDVGVLVKRQDVKKNGKRYAKRYIKQICVFSREDGINTISMFGENPSYTNDISHDENNKSVSLYDFMKEELPNLDKEKTEEEMDVTPVSIWKGGGTYYERQEVI